MNRFARMTLIVPALSLGLMLAGCESFDPTAIFDAEIFNTKKKLPGDRQAVFPEGTPGVPQGVPQELVKGYQAPEPEPPPPPAGRGKAETQAEAEGRGQAERRIGSDRGHGSAVASPASTAVATAVA